MGNRNLIGSLLTDLLEFCLILNQLFHTTMNKGYLSFDSHKLTNLTIKNITMSFQKLLAVWLLSFDIADKHELKSLNLNSLVYLR